MRVKNGLSAHFKEANGSSRPGVDWVVEMTQGDKTYFVRVRALLADEATRATRKDEAYQSHTAMEYLDTQLKTGWHPADEKEHTIYLSNPLPSLAQPGSAGSTQPWWKLW